MGVHLATHRTCHMSRSGTFFFRAVPGNPELLPAQVSDRESGHFGAFALDTNRKHPLALDTEMMFVSTSCRGLTRLDTDFGSWKGSVGSGREVLVAFTGRGVVTS